MSRNEFICDCNSINHELVEQTISQMPNDEIVTNLANFYKIIGDKTRCKILFALKQHEMCVCDLANVMSMTKSSISHQLSKMRECSMVKCEKRGKEVYYSLDDEHISEIFDISMAHISHRI